MNYSQINAANYSKIMMLFLSVTSDVQAFLEKFREMNETMDVLDSLDRIGDNSRELFRLGYPIGALLNEGVNMTEEVSCDY